MNIVIIVKKKVIHCFLFLVDRRNQRDSRNEPYKKHDRNSHHSHRSSRTPSIRHRDEPLTPNVRIRDTPSR